jgi:hypothetical protein
MLTSKRVEEQNFMSFKHKLIVNVLILAILSSFSIQLSATITPASNRKGFLGIVLAASGVPVSGATVIASGSEGSGYAVTNPSGEYLIDKGLETGTYTVTALKEGYLTEEKENVQVTVGSETSGINFNLTRSAGISGKVTDAVSGLPLEQVVVYAFAEGGAFGWTGITDSNGNYNLATNLATGTYNVTVLMPEGHVTKSRSVPVTAGVQITGIDMALDRSGIISGRATAFPSGTPLANVTVSAVAEGGQYYGYAQTNATGHYRMASGLGTGTYMVFAMLGMSFNQTTGVSVTAGTETANIDFELVTSPPPASGIITGKVLDATSQPIADAHVTAGTGEADTDSDGNYVISSGLPTGTYTVYAQAAGYQSQNITGVQVTENQVTPNINFQLSPIPTSQSGKISGTVQGEANPIPELPYPIVIMFAITLITAVIAREFNGRTKRQRQY